MPIPNIDNQMHIQRTMDYTRDASSINRRTEHMQHLSTQLGRVENEHQNNQVQELDTKENPRVREREEEGTGRGEGGAASSEAGGGEPDEERRVMGGELPLEPSVQSLKERENPPRVIDIRI